MKIHTSNFHFTLGKVNSETLNTVHNLCGICLKYLTHANCCNTGVYSITCLCLFR